LRRRIERAAQKNDRTLNAEIVARLEGSFEVEQIKLLKSGVEEVNDILNRLITQEDIDDTRRREKERRAKEKGER
jgi:hypothetical protein